MIKTLKRKIDKQNHAIRCTMLYSLEASPSLRNTVCCNGGVRGLHLSLNKSDRFK